MATGSLKCPKCDRTFGMAAHLARHLSAGHGKKPAVQKKAAKRADRRVAATAGAMAAGKKRGPGRPKGSGKKLGRPKGSGKRLGRPTGTVSRLGLKDMSLEQLSNVIQAARAEAHRRIAEFQDSIA